MIGLAATAAIAAAALAQAPPKAPAPVPASAPAWAYPINPPAAPGAAQPPVSNVEIHLPGASNSYAPSEVRNLFLPPDWRPEDHPPMPNIVAFGRKPAVQACGYCHLPTGNGRPENARLAGLPYDYIVGELKAYREGKRGTSVAGRTPTRLMADIGKAITDEEIAAAAKYFSSLTPGSHVRIIEGSTAPRTDVTGWIYRTIDKAGAEPLGQRIIETPEDFDVFELRDPETRYVAYAPAGSIARGKTLTGSIRAPDKSKCVDCHGDRFRGHEGTPGIAGMSPTAIVRALYDFKSGSRVGADSKKMGPVARQLSNDDMLAIAAYLASLPP